MQVLTTWQKLIWAWEKSQIAAAVPLDIEYILHHQQESTDSFVDFSKQNIATYPFPAKWVFICRRNSNLSSKQSVVRCVAFFSDCAARFVSDLVGNPEDRFSRAAAQIILR